MSPTKLEEMTGAPDAEFLAFARMHWPAMVKALRVAQSTADNWYDYAGAGNHGEWQSLLRSALTFLHAVGAPPSTREGGETH
jgi:hypothetical protein